MIAPMDSLMHSVDVVAFRQSTDSVACQKMHRVPSVLAVSKLWSFPRLATSRSAGIISDALGSQKRGNSPIPNIIYQLWRWQDYGVVHAKTCSAKTLVNHRLVTQRLPYDSRDF